MDDLAPEAIEAVAEVLFPTWGRGSDTAGLADGRRINLANAKVELNGVHYLFLSGN